MGTAVKTAACLKDTNVRLRDGYASQGNGLDDHLIVGRHHTHGWRYRAFARFDYGGTFWTGVYQIVRAEIVLKTTTAIHVSFGSSPKIKAQRLKEAFAEGNSGEGVWDASEYASASAPATSTSQGVVAIPVQENLTVRIDVTSIVEQCAPTSVKRRDGSPGGNLTNYGFRFIGYDEGSIAHIIEFYSMQSTAANRPKLELTYEQGPLKPNAPTLTVPSGTISSVPANFLGSFTDPNPEDVLQQTEIEVYLGSGGAKVWSGVFDAVPSEQEAGQFSVPYPESLRSQTEYEWRARVSDGRFWSDWSDDSRPYQTWTVSNTTPTVTAVPLADRATLAGTKFVGTFADADGDSLFAYQVQMRTQTTPGSPLWDGYDNLWDTGVVHPTTNEIANGRPETGYGGAELSAGIHTWRIRAQDHRGAWSAWSYDEFELTADYAPEYSLIEFLTLVGQKRPPARVVVRAITLNKWKFVTTADAGTWNLTYDGVTSGNLAYNASAADVETALEALIGDSSVSCVRTVSGDTRTYEVEITRGIRVEEVTASESLTLGGSTSAGKLTYVSTSDRGPGPVVAIIEDPNGLGASQYLNAGGEFHMTLPALHPQVSAIVPWLTHYSLQVWWGDRFRPIFEGLIVDVDATEDDAVFLGIDYLAMLDLTVDERYDPAKPDKPHSQGGSKYVDQQIGDIIHDQLLTAQFDNSPVKFVTVPAKGQPYFDVFSEHVTIYSTYAQRLAFIGGLIDSHKEGKGKRARLWCEQTLTGGYRWRLSDDVGRNRDNIVFEYGGLVQNFRTVLFGDFATVAAGFGRTKNGTTVMYKSAPAPGMSQNVWGRIVRPSIYQDLSDAADLERRTGQAAATLGRVGKRVALGLRVDALHPLDGYDIGDFIPVRLLRGVVDTERYGAGYWTIMGIEWNMDPDGSTDLTLSVLPKEDGSKPDEDLIPFSSPLSSREWAVGYGPPADDLDALYYYDSMGRIWIRNENGEWVIYGSNADVITDGNLPGGSNLIPDGSFEMAPWPASSAIIATWDTDAQFGDTNAADGQSASYSGMTTSSNTLILSPAP